tara:strand:+ start:417 stop:1277 length:861 start_codon:yes stop_codon:yes gene_type:complete
MSKGVLLFAYNNQSVDYLKQAVYCAKRIKEFLNLDVAVCTDNIPYLKKTYPFYKNYITHVIEASIPETKQTRVFYDGSMANRTLPWKNHNRSDCYEVSPFDETIVMDTDIIVSNDKLLECFNYNEDFLIYKTIHDINPDRPDKEEYLRISDRSIDMYWATIFYFKKTDETKFYFDLVKHIRENWHYYRLIYQIPTKNFRNDFAFSIAIHILNGFTKQHWPKQPPGNLWFTTDRDVLHQYKDEKFYILLDKKHWMGHYTINTVKDCNLHLMNKFSLNRHIDKEFVNE